ncbi:MAG: hypothetical protein R3C26_05070 [Calditrichia bacterium]
MICTKQQLLLPVVAQSVNEEYYQKKRDHQILEELDGGFDDDFLAMEQEEAETKVMAETEENPITIAMRDFYAGKELAYHYDSPRKSQISFL